MTSRPAPSRIAALFLFSVLAVLAGPARAQDPPAQVPSRSKILTDAEEARAARDFGRARTLYTQALRSNPRDGRAALGLAEVLIELNESAAAESLLQGLAKSLPQRPEVRRAYALALLRTGKTQDALVQAQAAVKLDPNNPDSRLTLGAASNAVRRPAQAIPEFERVLKTRPRDLAALHGLARSYAALEDPQAEEIYRRLLAAAPENVMLRLDFVEYLWGASKPEEGNAEMGRLLSQIPENPKLRAHYGIKLIEQRRFVDAAEQLERAVDGGARDYEVFYFLGSALLENGRFEDAAARLREAIAVDPARVAGRHILGRLLILQNKAAEAVEQLTEAVRVEPGSAPVQLDLGRALEASRNMEKAEAAYREALKRDPNLTQAHYALGTLLARAGKREEAVRHIALHQAAFEKDQEKRRQESARRAELNLGWSELRNNRPAAALAQFRRLGNDFEALHGAARALSRLGRSGESIRAYQRAIALSPQDPRLSYELQRERAKLTRKR